MTETNAASAILAAEGISVTLGGRAILNDVSIAIGVGDVLGVFGPSGAGKSTLFRVLAGELTPDRGVVRLDGVDVTRRPLFERARAGLGWIPQTPSVLFDLSVAENIAVFERLARGSKPGEGERIARDLGLGDRFDVRAGALSGGERRRLELTRALIARPCVLLCDEPFSAVDPTGTGKIAALLAVLREGGTAIILADHNLTAALPLCRRAALLVAGEIREESLSDEFSDHDLVRSHYIVG